MFNLKEYEKDFISNHLLEFNLDSLKYSLNEMKMLDSLDYARVFQEEFHYSSYDVNPYYFYSIQSNNKEFSSITILHYKESLFTELILVNHNSNGLKVSDKTVSISGGDGEWYFGSNTKYLDSLNLESNYLESSLIEESDSVETWTIFKKKELIEISHMGKITTQSIDSTREEINYR